MTPSALAKSPVDLHPKAAEGRSAAGEDPVKRGQILEGARRIFVAVGFDAASMNDITREAGVSKSTLYVYFRSKEELFTALIAETRDAYFARIEKIFTDPTHPAETSAAKRWPFSTRRPSALTRIACGGRQSVTPSLRSPS